MHSPAFDYEARGVLNALEQRRFGRGHPHLPSAFQSSEQGSPPHRIKMRRDFVQQQDRRLAASLGYDFAAMEQAGILQLCWQPTTEGLLDQVGARLLERVEAQGSKRVLIDSLGAFSRLAIDPARLNAFFRALVGELRARDVSVMLTWEMRDIFGAEISAPAPDLSSIVDNLMLMRFVELDSQLRRMLSILKVRDSHHDPALHELLIGPQGITLRKAFEGACGVLSGPPVPQGSG